MNILITGAAGFIGSHLCEKLLSLGHCVVGVDNFDPFYPRAIKEQNLVPALKSPLFKFYEADLCHRPVLSEIFANHQIDAVIHLAAKGGVRPSLDDPESYLQTNIKATICLMETMRHFSVNKMIFASSSSIYGQCPNTPFSENESFEHAISIYATTKQAGELFNRMYYNLYHFSIINLRLFTVYGARQRPDLAISKFMRANLEGKKINLFSNGEMSRDYTYIDDVTNAFHLALLRLTKETRLFETFNIGNSKAVELKQLIEKIEQVTKRKSLVSFQEAPAGDVFKTCADITKAKEILNYAPQIDLFEGLSRFHRWLSASEEI